MIRMRAPFHFSRYAARKRSLRAASVAVTLVIILGSAFPSKATGEQRKHLLVAQTADSAYDPQYLLNLAEQGDARAAFLLGTRFASGRGGARDDSEAFRWFERAAEAGLAEAQYNLGVMYASGRGVARNMAAAARWYEEAAKQGIAEAQFNMGTLYGLGLGVEKNEIRAAEWLEKAAHKSLPQAQYNLGVLYEHGRGVRLDVRIAMAWYRRAAEQGYARARVRLESLEERLTPPGERNSAPARDSVLARASNEAAAGSDWIARLDSEKYTLQLLSDTDEANVQRFVARNVDPGQGGYFASRIDGKLWYSVVYGAYPSYESAKAAADELPPTLRRLKPWVRKVGSIQKKMLR